MSQPEWYKLLLKATQLHGEDKHTESAATYRSSLAEISRISDGRQRAEALLSLYDWLKQNYVKDQRWWYEKKPPAKPPETTYFEIAIELARQLAPLAKHVVHKPNSGSYQMTPILMLACDCMRAGDFDLAQKLYERELKALDWLEHGKTFDLLNLLRRSGRMNQAEQILKANLQCCPKESQFSVLHSLAMCKVYQKQFTEAQKYFEQLERFRNHEYYAKAVRDYAAALERYGRSEESDKIRKMMPGQLEGTPNDQFLLYYGSND